MTTTLARSVHQVAEARPQAGARGRPTSRPAYAYLAGATALSVTYYLIQGQPRELVWEIVAASSVAAIVFGIHRYRPQPSLPWWLLAGGMLLWVIGDVIWSWYPVFTGRELSTPSVADVAYLMGYPLLLTSIALTVKTRRSILRRSGWIDAAIVAVVAGLLIWEFALESSLSQGLTLGTLVNASYPLMDAILIGFLARLLFAPGPRTPAYSFLVVAVGLTLFADIAYAGIVAADWWTIYEPLTAAWLAGYVLIGTAALHPTMVTVGGTPDRREHPLSRRRTLVLAVVASLPIVAFIVSVAVGHDDSPMDTGLGMLLVLGMVFFRLSSLIGSIEQQSTELAVLHDDRGLVLDEITRAIEEERTRMAAELHDGPIQRVTGLGMRAYMGAQRLRAGDEGGAAGALEQIEEGLNHEVRALRALMTQLRPPVLSERGLVDALRDHADAITAERGIATVVEGSIDSRPNEEAETGLYRIAQEALMNACRHSRATRVLVRVEPVGRSIRLTVQDDGVGFDDSTRFGHDGGKHFGLLAMRERAAMLHGSLTVTSAPGRGTTLVADVPIQDEPLSV